nr:hypothetical protein [Tanacetum cinerariifolium]
MEHVADEAVHKELGDNLVRACQEAMGDTTAQNRVESLDNKENLGEDASKQGRIEAIDQDEDITLVNVQDDVEMSNVDDFCGEEIFVAEQEVVKGIVIQEQEEPAQEQEELTDAEKDTLFTQLLKKRRKHFAAKRAEEKRNKPPTQAQNRKITCTYLNNMEGYTLKQLKPFEFDKIQEMFDREFKRVNTFEPIRSELVERKEKRAGEELIQERSKKQKVEDDKETLELKQLMEIIPNEKEVEIDAIPLDVKSLKIVDRKIYKEGKKSYYQIIRADGKIKMYMVFSKMLESFDREDLEDLYKLVTAKFKLTSPVEDLDLLLWGDLKTMFEPHVEDVI